MSKRMLVFDFRSGEKEFFDTKDFLDFTITFFEGSLNEKMLKKISFEDKKNTEIISVFLSSNIDKKILDEFENLKIIATRSTGFNHINLEECKLHSVAVTNVTKYGAKTVAQYVFGLIIALVRKIIPAFLDMKKLQNHPQNYVGNDLDALTLGVIGTGEIGSNLCKIADFVGMKILAYDLVKDDELVQKHNVEYVDLKTLLKDSDIVSIHLPYNDGTYHIISTEELELMKPSAYLINTSRGELIDTNSLYQALTNNVINGCALDVGECEDFSFDMDHFWQKIPQTTRNCLARALVLQKTIELPSVIITPHIAYSTKEAVKTIVETTAKSIKDFYEGKRTNRIV